MKRTAIWLALPVILTGCATILDGTSQQIALTSNPPDAHCVLWRENALIGETRTPGGVLVEKIKHDITVKCTKEGYQEATTVLDSGIEAATWGNIVLGGFIGWGVDSASGADNNYPEQVTITLVPAQ